MKIGIPSALFYYEYYVLWYEFFKNLGCEVITSESTNKQILNLGIMNCVDDACIPVKVYHGHVASLIDKVDALFIPRIISISKNEYICPKFCGLPEMVKNQINNIPYMITTPINLKKSKKALIDAVLETGSIITNNKHKIIDAYKNALVCHKNFINILKTTGDFQNAIENKKYISKEYGKRIALLGHSYNVYDNYINMNIVNKLHKNGFGTITLEMLDSNKIDKEAQVIQKRHFWTHSRRIIGAGLSLIKDNSIDGIIYISSFGCGIDSLIEDYLSRYIKRNGKIPYMKIIIDEHSGEAGLNTRIEAFTDMINWRCYNENYFSSYGRSLYSC